MVRKENVSGKTTVEGWIYQGRGSSPFLNTVPIEKIYISRTPYYPFQEKTKWFHK